MKKTNKLISIFLSIAMLLSMAPMTVLAATVEASGNFGASGTNLTWSLDSDGVLTISGSGEMEDFANAASVPWYRQRSNIKTVVIESGVTNIGKDAFYGISSLVNATISDTVTSIGNRAFSNSALTNFEFSDAGNLKSIGNSAFNSTRIKSMVIPDGVTTLGSYVFGYGPIKSVTIPASVTSVGNYFFEEATDLNEVIFLGNKEPENIGNTVFLGCSSLAYVSVPADYEGDTFSNMKVAKAAASVAEVNGQGFTTLADAVSAAQSINGAELKLLSHISIDSGITIESGNFTIDLNGKELFSNGYYVLRVDGADVTIVDSAGGGIFNATNDQGNIVLEVLSGSANISGGTFNSVSYPVTVKDGTLKLTGKDFIFSNGNKRIGWHGGNVDLSACTADEVRIQPNAEGLQASAVTLPDGWGLFKTNGTPCTDFVKYDAFVAKAGCKVTASVNPAEGGTVEGAGTYGSGATVNLTASAANGYRFVNWTENGEEVSTSAVYTFTVSENRELTANFEIVPHTHSFTYSASGDTITAVCENTDGNCPDPEGTLTIFAPADLYVDGTTAKEAIVDNQLADTSVTYEVTYSTADGSAPATAGTYTASVTLGGATASVQFELVKRSTIAENFVYTAPENLVYDGTAKYATVEVVPEITGMGEITVTYYKDGEAVEPINAGTYTVKVSTAESDKYYAINDVELASFTIEKKAVTVSATVPDRIYGDDYRVDTSKVIITFDVIVEGDDVGCVVTDAYYQAHNVTNNAPVQVDYNVNGADAGNYQFPEFGDWLAPNYGVQATGKVLPRDIANAEITLGDALTYNGEEQAQEVTSVTVDGLDVTYDISGNKAKNVGVYEIAITGNGNFTGTKTVLYTINPDLSGIEGLDQYNVKSTNKADVEYVYNQLDNAVTDLASAEKEAEWKEIKDECWQWLKILESVAYRVESLGNSYLAYDIDTVTSADDEALLSLEAEIYLCVRDYGDNMTEEELDILDNAWVEIANLRERIAKTKSEYDRVIAAVNGYDEATVTSADKDALVQLNEDIYALALIDNVTAEEKLNLEAAHDKVFGLIDKLTNISDEIKRIIEAVDKYVFESVKSSDKADIQQLIADIKALLDTQNITADERTILEGADETCDKLVAKIDETVAEINRINDATDAYDIDTVTSDDKADIEKLIADIKALTDGDNITDAEREQLVANDETLDALLAKINVTADEIERIENAVAPYDEATVKSTDKADLELLKEDVQALIDSTNTTENENTALGEMNEKVNALLDKISETEEKLEEIKEIENNYNPENVSSDDKAAIEESIAEIEAVNPDNLTDEQKAEYAEIKAEFEALLDKIEEASKAVADIGAELEMFKENRVTIFWEDEIEALKAKIDELLADENMGEAEKSKLEEYKAQCDNLIEIINTPVKYLSLRIFWFIWDAIVWLVNHIVFIFSWLFAKLK